MPTINDVFIRSVETAVGNSMSQGLTLLVYISATEDENTWIHSLLTDNTLQVMNEKAVCLRLVQGTPEFHMFEQFFAKVVVPSVYCIRASIIWDVLHGTLDRDGFDSRINSVINGERHADAQPTPVVQSGVDPSAHSQVPSQESTPAPNSHPQVHSQASGTSAEPSAESGTPTSSPAPKHHHLPIKKDNRTLKEQSAELLAKNYKEEQLRKAKVAKEEKERVKRLLKADEEERRSKNKRTNEERERQRRLSNDEDAFDDEHCIDEIILENKSLRDNIHRRATSSSGDVCALAIRILDGTSLKHNFLATNTLNDVREWLDVNRTDGDEPYCFHRTIPRTTFGVTDEEKTLESLELTPRSALILKPFHKFTDAYSTTNQTSSGIFSRIYSGISSFWGAPEAPEANHNRQQQQFHDNHVERYRDDISTTTNSQYVSPLHSPSHGHDLDLPHPSSLNLNFNPNDLSIPQRPATPTLANTEQSNARINSPTLSRANSNLATFRTLNSESTKDDRTTYNGNHVNLEDDKNKK